MTVLNHDFRSDTVTRPDAPMLAAMFAADVGDDVYGEDRTVRALEEKLCALMGKEDAAFMPSGTQSNLIALMVHCERGDEYIAGQNAHLYKFEQGGAAVLGSIQPQPIENLPNGSLDLAKIKEAIKLDDIHFARTRLLALENTIGGRVLPQNFVINATDLARKHGLNTHLDGARVFNAAVASGVDVAELAEPFDTISVCLSKGLGAPIGSVLVGNKQHIMKAKRLRKMLGGGMRQAGYLAAAGIYALDHNVERLALDHVNAKRLAQGFAQFKHVTVEQPQTNIVFTKVDPDYADSFIAHMKENNIIVSGRYGELRWVTHKDLSAHSVEAALNTAADFFSSI